MLVPLGCRYPKLDGQNLEFVGGDGPRESDTDAGGAGNTKSVAKSVGMAMLQSLAFSAAGGASISFGAGSGASNAAFPIDVNAPSMGDGELEFFAMPAASMRKFRLTRRSVAWSDPDHVAVSRSGPKHMRAAAAAASVDPLTRAVSAAETWRVASDTQRVTLTLRADWVRIAAERSLFDALLIADLALLFRIPASRLQVLSVRRAYDLTQAPDDQRAVAAALAKRQARTGDGPLAASSQADEQPMVARVVIEIAADPADAPRASSMHTRALALADRIRTERREAAERAAAAAADEAARRKAVLSGWLPAPSVSHVRSMPVVGEPGAGASAANARGADMLIVQNGPLAILTSECPPSLPRAPAATLERKGPLAFLAAPTPEVHPRSHHVDTRAPIIPPSAALTSASAKPVDASVAALTLAPPRSAGGPLSSLFGSGNTASANINASVGGRGTRSAAESTHDPVVISEPGSVAVAAPPLRAALARPPRPATRGALPDHVSVTVEMTPIGGEAPVAQTTKPPPPSAVAVATVWQTLTAPVASIAATVATHATALTARTDGGQGGGCMTLEMIDFPSHRTCFDILEEVWYRTIVAIDFIVFVLPIVFTHSRPFVLSHNASCGFQLQLKFCADSQQSELHSGVVSSLVCGIHINRTDSVYARAQR